MHTLNRKERERLRHRKEIIETAERIFSEKSYYLTSIQEIADAVEFSVGTIYNFFESKEDLYSKIFQFRFDEYMKMFEDVFISDDSSLRKIRKINVIKIKFFEKHKSFFLLYFHSTAGSGMPPGLDESSSKRYDDYLQKIELVFKEAINTGKIKQIDPENLAVAFEGLTNAFIFHWGIKKKESTLSELIPQIEEIFFKRILK
ncbi:MAG TPA: TetR/AcrR family transcriptional regulator [archaeon]|nr:TetR/AcrR family transcriptional regulator [archaeon]